MLAGGIGAIGFVHQHRQRRFEAVREIAGFAERAADRVVAMIEQRVQIIHQRLNFGWIAAFEPPLAAVANGGQACAQFVERRKAARASAPRR